jgi:hypothetical protein
MKKIIPIWLSGLGATLAVIIVPILLFLPKSGPHPDNPASHLEPTAVPVSHADIIKGPLNTPQEVTRACLSCHPDAAAQVMKTTHWTWESQPFNVPWRDQPVTIGKINQINNFCIGTQGNQKQCMSCHIGYGWQENAAYDFSNPENVDCLACHADTSVYGKGNYGNPADGVSLVAAAKNVGMPT